MTTDNSPARIRKAAAGLSTSEPRNTKPKAMSDKNVISHNKELGSKDQDHNLSKGDCDRVKSLITMLHGLGIITRGKVNKGIDCSGSAVIIFPSKDGPGNGPDSDVFQKASAWFSQEQVVEMTVPRRPRHWSPPRLDYIHLEGQETLSVPVFDSCDEVRSKIEAYINQEDGLLRNLLCKAIFAQLEGTHFKKIDVIQLDRFRAKRGPAAGAKDIIYYAAYVFFEKLRIAEGEGKSEHRLKMEALYPHGFKYKIPKPRCYATRKPITPEYQL